MPAKLTHAFPPCQPRLSVFITTSLIPLQLEPNRGSSDADPDLAILRAQLVHRDRLWLERGVYWRAISTWMWSWGSSRWVWSSPPTLSSTQLIWPVNALVSTS
jgi:hypothetical protein